MKFARGLALLLGFSIRPSDASYSSDSICHSLSTSQCEALTTLTSLQSISQRDVAGNLTILDAIFLSLDMKTTFFEPQGYTQETLNQVSEVLFLGYKSLHVDLYWNEQGRYWQLCPFILGSSGTVLSTDATSERNEQTLGNITCSDIALKALLDQYYSYISSTSSDFVTSVLHFYIRLHSLGTPPAAGSQASLKKNTQQLGQIVFNAFGSVLYTPEDLKTDRENGNAYSQSYQIRDDTSGFPLSSQFLIQANKRIFVTAQNYSLAPDTSYPSSFLKKDEEKLFVKLSSDLDLLEINTANGDMPYVGMSIVYTDDTDLPTCLNLSTTEFIENINELASATNISDIDTSVLAPAGLGGQWVFIADTPDNPFTVSTISAYITCGFIPLVSAPINAHNITNLVPLANSAIWSWAPDEPTSEGKAAASSKGAADSNDDTRRFRCAVMDTDGWRVANCYDEYPTLCSLVLPTTLKSSGSMTAEEELDQGLIYVWIFGANSSYFDAPDSCPDYHTVTTEIDGENFTETFPVKFGIPESALQDTSVRIQLAENGTISFPIWIDLNSLQISDCWTVGGPDAKCLYNPSQWNRNKVALLSIAVTITFFLLVVIVFLKSQKLPVRHNENRFKRLINKSTESQYEGVPA